MNQRPAGIPRADGSTGHTSTFTRICREQAGQLKVSANALMIQLLKDASINKRIRMLTLEEHIPATEQVSAHRNRRRRRGLAADPA